MKTPVTWMAKNHVAANLLMGFVLLSGLFALLGTRKETFPEFSLDQVQIQVPYLGASPEEVEEGVCKRIEERVRGLEGVRRVRSTAAEGMGTVMVELELGADAREVLDEIKSNVDAITTFPIETEAPIIRDMNNSQAVVDIAVSGNLDTFTLKATAEQVRNELTAIPEITQVSVISAPPYEISIEVSEVALRRHGLTFDQVANAVRRSSLDLPGGSVRADSGEILLRTVGQAYRGEEYEKIVLWTRPDGSRLQLGDVATVVDGFAETDQYGRPRRGKVHPDRLGFEEKAQRHGVNGVEQIACHQRQPDGRGHVLPLGPVVFVRGGAEVLGHDAAQGHALPQRGKRDQQCRSAQQRHQLVFRHDEHRHTQRQRDKGGAPQNVLRGQRQKNRTIGAGNPELGVDYSESGEDQRSDRIGPRVVDVAGTVGDQRREDAQGRCHARYALHRALSAADGGFPLRGGACHRHRQGRREYRGSGCDGSHLGRLGGH